MCREDNMPIELLFIPQIYNENKRCSAKKSVNYL